MISPVKEARPDMDAVLSHCMFWDNEKKLRLIMDFSDHLEFLNQSHQTVKQLEVYSKAAKTLDGCLYDWSCMLDEVLLRELNKYRKYNTASFADLLRFIRNKRNHFRELPPEGQKLLSKNNEKFLRYFSKRFPLMVIVSFNFIKDHLNGEDMFKPYFKP